MAMFLNRRPEDAGKIQSNTMNIQHGNNNMAMNVSMGGDAGMDFNSGIAGEAVYGDYVGVPANGVMTQPGNDLDLPPMSANGPATSASVSTDVPKPMKVLPPLNADGPVTSASISAERPEPPMSRGDDMGPVRGLPGMDGSDYEIRQNPHYTLDDEPGQVTTNPENPNLPIYYPDHGDITMNPGNPAGGPAISDGPGTSASISADGPEQLRPEPPRPEFPMNESSITFASLSPRETHDFVAESVLGSLSYSANGPATSASVSTDTPNPGKDPAPSMHSRKAILREFESVAKSGSELSASQEMGS